VKKKKLTQRTEKEIRNDLTQHLGLHFTDESWVELLALVDAKTRLDYSSRALSSETVLKECKQLRGAAQQLSTFLGGSSKSGMPWGSFLQSRLVDERINKGEDEDLLFDPHWASNFQDTLRLFSEVSEMVAAFHATQHGTAGRNPDKHRRQFAQCLSDHFIRAGGVFNSGGLAGFPHFLECVWELLPAECRPKTPRSFADMLGRLVDKSDRQQTSPSKADYCIRLTRTYWGIPRI